MTECKWVKNPKYKNLPDIGVGDIVHLKVDNTFDYLIKCIVTQIESPKISIYVDAVFDWHGLGQITSGDFTSLVGKNLTTEKFMIHKVIKKP